MLYVVLDSCLLSWNWGWEKCKKNTTSLSLSLFFEPLPRSQIQSLQHRVGLHTPLSGDCGWTIFFIEGCIMWTYHYLKASQHNIIVDITSADFVLVSDGIWGRWIRKNGENDGDCGGKRVGRWTSIRFLFGWFYYVVQMMFLLLFYCLWKMMKNLAVHENKHVGTHWLGAVIV